MQSTSLKQLACIVLLLIGVAASAQEPEKIRIGVSLPMTGDAASYGIDLKNIISFANDELGHGRYELIFEDDKCTGLDASNVAHKFIDIDKVKYVTGFGCSGSLLSAAPIYEKARVLAMAAGTSSPSITNAGDYIFRVCPSDVITAKYLASYVSKKHKSIGIISEETDYCESLANAFEKDAEADGMKVFREGYAPGQRDFRNLLLRLKMQKIDALFLNPQTETALGLLAKQIHEMKWNLQLYSVYYPSSPVFLKMAGEAANGIIYVDFGALQRSVSKEGYELYERYLKKYGKPRSVDWDFILGWNAFAALSQAIEKGGDVKANLYNSNFSSPIGISFHFDKNGDFLSDLMLHTLNQIQNDKAVQIQ